jgi:hypothetical protein
MDVWSAVLDGEDEQLMMIPDLLGEPNQDLVRSEKRYTEINESPRDAANK